MNSAKIAELSEKVNVYIKRSFDDPDEDRFNDLALEVFQFQYQSIAIYKKLCDKRGLTPLTVSSWRTIPPISTEAFKLFDLFSASARDEHRMFHTSGTTQGTKKGRSFFSETGLGLMQQAIIQGAAHYFLPDDLRLRFLIIAPSPERSPHMIMTYGMDILKKSFGLPGSRFLVGENGFIPEELEEELRKAEDENVPVALIGASLGLLAFFDYCTQNGHTFKLPPGSRSLDAGGYKGRKRAVTSEEFLSLVERYLGIEQQWSINLLGMTELGSQFYDTALKHYFNGSGHTRCKENSPWTRTKVVDPCTLEEVSLERNGILCHLDLTNIERIMAIQTDDIGKRRENGFEITGRARGAEARGCSLSIEQSAIQHETI